MDILLRKLDEFEDTIEKSRREAEYIINEVKENEKKTKNQFSTWNYQHSKVDRFFLVLAPFLFLIFNTIYWSYFYLWDKMAQRIEND